MDAFTAQMHAVVATAQLAAALPDEDFDVRVRTEARLEDRAWVVQVRWHDGPERHSVAHILEGPPADVHLVRHITIPELNSERSGEL